MTSGPASYKIPAVADMPLDLRVKLVENRKNPEDTVFHSKAVGEPPFMLVAAWCAIKDAVASSVIIVISRTSTLRLRRKRCCGAVSRCVSCTRQRLTPMNNWISALAELQARSEPGILVTIIEELGSTPRNAGSKMVVCAERIYDTIGGGHLEYKAMEIAREMLASGTGWNASVWAQAWSVLWRRQRAAVRADGRACCAHRGIRCRPCRPRAGATVGQPALPGALDRQP